MEWTCDQVLELLRSWKEAKERPTLIIELATPGLAHATALGEVDSVSDESVTLVFGRQAWGTGLLTLPLRGTQFTYVKPSDEPDIPIHSHDRMIGCLELKFPGNPECGCYITEIKPGVFTYIDKIDRVVLEMR